MFRPELEVSTVTGYGSRELVKAFAMPDTHPTHVLLGISQTVLTLPSSSMIETRVTQP